MRKQACTKIAAMPLTWLGRQLALLGFLIVTLTGAHGAGLTDLSNRPLATSGTVPIKPNLLFILDNSGSMQFGYMPDTMVDFYYDGSADPAHPVKVLTPIYGTNAAQCNGLAYDPTMSYPPPLKDDGTSYPPASFIAAYEDGWNKASLTWDKRPNPPKNLTGSYYYKYWGAEPKMNWKYDLSGEVKNTFYQECRTPEPATPVSTALFEKVDMLPTSADAQNYANWYSYYSKRYLLMRTAVGRAIASLDSGFRVGFSTITDQYGLPGGGRLFLDVKDFDQAQKTNFYANLYSATPKTNTPLRGALSKAGRYFANKAPSQSYDPVQYSCQRNYALLTTDGYWDTLIEDSGGVKFGPYKLDNATPVGDQDGSESRPMKDAVAATNTLADISEYYYATDLRTTALGNCTSTSSGSTQDVCKNNLRVVQGDQATWQHMNTYTIGMGVSGTLIYDKDYLTQPAGSYANLTAGNVDWPKPTVSPGNGDATNIDDLWHAAVNGRGQYYSALSSSALVDAITGVMSTLQQATGSASAASTSSLELVVGSNNQVYRASYTTERWTGDLQAFALNGADASIAPKASWSAQEKLDATTATSRKIFFSGSSGLQDFSYTNLTTAQQALFDGMCSKLPQPTQCSSLAFSDLALANTGANLVNYLRGTRAYESPVAAPSAGVSATAQALFRKRDHVLGDIINGAPVHVGKPPFEYGDAGYADFVVQQKDRKNVVYTAANDGMLHAFSADPADGGTELWAFIPTAVMPNLYKLADTAYGAKHEYFVDGAPVMGDVFMNGEWRTILVGGLNAGGRSYYALDVTNPVAPKFLWEFSDANLGLTFGNPWITKRAGGKWIVAFASGYNNTAGDGTGHLYLLDAANGTKLLDISNGVGSPTNPSGLAQINVWIDKTYDNTAKRFYGGDMLGNLWRFDIDNLVVPNQSAMLLAKLNASAGTPQPITTRPELSLVSSKPVVLVATGRYLGTSDVSDTSQQTVYGIKDPMTATGWGDVRANTADFVKQDFTFVGPSSTATSAGITDNKVDWSVKGGWWADLPHTGERVGAPPTLQYNVLALATAIPNSDACSLGGSSWRYFLNVDNGGPVTTSPPGVQWSANALLVGLSWIKDSSGNVRLVGQGSNGEIRTEIPANPNLGGTGVAHRNAWRELTD
jgi:type IV pilus assembly protein PilY1